MARLNSEETLWTVLPIIAVLVLLIGGIVLLPQTNTDVRSRASEPKKAVTPNPTITTTLTRPVAPEVVCSDLYAPVCGSDGKTYPSVCEAGLVGVTTYTEGACSSSSLRGGTPTRQSPSTQTTPPKDPQMQYILPVTN